MSKEELNKMMAIKEMDLEECQLELNSRYYPAIVRVAMMNYITILEEQLKHYNELIKREGIA
ncbi:hypothetical protein SAMN05192533_12514 [Mesobacillus persicus]|uniref:Uncharacterized protein n=1 Tax=Mesobacillus persicus TaxID=930146 RepID=A0A1H8K8C7_9BACI|nr:hypothetical protein [Mesobacillus persicus]SEN88726.1 hypothetical protein SAMN05192533_12514 [Mesobacillus persicus]